MIVQCYIGGTVLHLCDSMGPRAVHSLWYSVCRLCHTAECHSVYLGGTDILSALSRGLPMVVEVNLLCWVRNIQSLLDVLVYYDY